MTISSIRQRIISVLADHNMSKDARIAELKEMYVTARGIQRAATESPMNDDDGLNDDLREIERALQKLGIHPDGPEDGAATL